MKRIMDYLFNTINRGILFKGKGEITIECFVDTNFGGSRFKESGQVELEYYKSTSGFLLKLYGDTFMCRSKRQNCITTEAEFVALSITYKEVMMVKNLYERIMDIQVKSIVYEDNKKIIRQN